MKFWVEAGRGGPLSVCTGLAGSTPRWSVTHGTNAELWPSQRTDQSAVTDDYDNVSSDPRRLKLWSADWCLVGLLLSLCICVCEVSCTKKSINSTPDNYICIGKHKNVNLCKLVYTLVNRTHAFVDTTQPPRMKVRVQTPQWLCYELFTASSKNSMNW